MRAATRIDELLVVRRYHLGLDGGCLAVTPGGGGGDIVWVHQASGERSTFPLGSPDFVAPALTWLDGRDVVTGSL